MNLRTNPNIRQVSGHTVYGPAPRTAVTLEANAPGTPKAA